MSSFQIKDITICLHCGWHQHIVDRQTKELEELSNDYNVTWNNRITRFPQAYPSYSELINHSIELQYILLQLLQND